MVSLQPDKDSKENEYYQELQAECCKTETFSYKLRPKGTFVPPKRNGYSIFNGTKYRYNLWTQMQYATMFHVEKMLRQYLEVLL